MNGSVSPEEKSSISRTSTQRDLLALSRMAWTLGWSSFDRSQHQTSAGENEVLLDILHISVNTLYEKQTREQQPGLELQYTKYN